ncbi:hydantoinase/oxoprolinase family protein [Paracraurococcus lichenis]|uniref:Hydantoinase/oxoprolinase family protein n=1 Tax=Paracraurococcus lichenis TaxID=3064888 RepID=A0ABT9E5S1_9PROT|nr:hydantoinase/oxoprolinase family protein [Paracraurococcus sp. LOR1-02]MDO9711481.1 hydantoinase/oxoprolinase family protein [Paracraurococcus sp. LOR1-02]
MGAEARPRLAVDIGGTFTDVVVETPRGRVSAKVLTTRHAPELGVLEGMRKAVKLAGVAPAEIGLIVHGTTLATNAIIERKGAVTALVTTEGFRDVVEMAYEHRFEQYDIFMEKPKPLIARPLRFGVPERMDAKGQIRLPLDEAALPALAETLHGLGVESIAIGFLHSYANPAHEQRAGEILAGLLPGVRITLSADVCPELREYERFTTACANAYVQPLMARYLAQLRDAVAAAGYGCPVLLMTSGGGLTTLETAMRYPIRLVESGPAGGAILATVVAEELGLDRILSFDMGGTTAKICVIDDGKPMASRSFEVDRQYNFLKGSGFPVRIPVIEMVEIGAGGGSIAGVDAMGRVQVGPGSAGADPGPACYARGGTAPTVTDANVALGRIDPAHFAGGSIALDAKLGATAIGRDVGEKLKVPVPLAAFAISEMVEENMANAARVHAVERGTELADRSMIAFGGSAPLHAARLARKLGIRDVIIPASAGVGSAVGFLCAPIGFQVVRSRIMRLGDFDPAAIAAMLATMAAEASAVVRLGAPEADIGISRSVEMRYLGQGHEISVALPDAATATDPAALRRRFEAGYAQLFGRIIPGQEIETTAWTLTAAAPAPRLVGAAAVAAAGPPALSIGTRLLFDPDRGEAAEVPVYRRSAIAPGQRIAGPAVLVEDETTTIVAAGFTASLAASGAIRLSMGAGT